MTTVDIPRRAWVEQVMGMPVSVHLRGDDPSHPRAAQAVAAVFAELRHVEAVFSTWRDDSEISRWERGELALDEADPTLAEVIDLCARTRTATDGWFDPHGLPDPRNGTPRYDPSGLVKGWAVARAARHVATLDGYGWCLNAGGDIALYAPPGQPPWRIGIEDPQDPRRSMLVVARAGGAVATSGGTHRGAHIIDPYRRRPASAVRAVTLTGPDLMWADVHATAAAAQGADALQRLDRLGADGYQAAMVTRSGALLTTDGWVED